MNNRNAAPLLRAGQIVYFVHLHLDTVRHARPHDFRENHLVFEVEGKARPMLVWKCEGEKRGHRWYRVFPMTRQKLNKRGFQVPFGDEYINLDPRSIPDNMLYCEGSRSPVVKSLDPQSFGCILKIMSQFGLVVSTE